jgi:hypothetical protein
LNGGEPQEEHKAAIEKGIKKKFTGSEGDRVIIMFNKSKDNAADIVPLSNTMLTKEDFTNINNLIQQEIFAGHQIVSPALMGIKTEGQLGGRTELRDAYEIFNNTYVQERQETHNENFGELFSLIGIPGEYVIEPVEPLKFEFGEQIIAANLTQNEIREIMGKQPLEVGQVTSDGKSAVNEAPATSQLQPTAAEINSNLAGMTGRQFQQLERIKRKYEKGSLTREQAAMMLRNGFGLTDADISLFLDTNPMDAQFATQEEIDNDLVQGFSECGEDANQYEILEYKPTRELDYFADQKQLNELESNIINLIKKDKGKIEIDTIAATLEKSKDTIQTAIERLIKAGVLSLDSKKIGTDKIPVYSVKEQNYINYKPSITELIVRFTYAWRDIVPASERNTPSHPSRPFCVKMVELAKTKVWSRADIEAMSARLGYSVWDRVGGWWNRGTENDTQCRHEWRRLILKRKIQ